MASGKGTGPAADGSGSVGMRRPRAVGARRGWNWRGALRSIHRDTGYVAVGLTVVYAVSGLAVNHIADWDPNFSDYQRTVQLAPMSGDDGEIARSVIARLGIEGAPTDVYRASPEDLQVVLERRTLHVNSRTGAVFDEGQRPRFFVRAANWLHLNRGKRAWTVIADGYAAALLLLAFSGMLIMPGKRGVLGRHGLFVLAGVAVPVLYMVVSGGP